VAAIDTALARLFGRTPEVPLEGVSMSARRMYFDSSKAVRELGMPQRPVEAAFERAVLWFRGEGYVAS
jgi:dihydroflavonol-4-reductase